MPTYNKMSGAERRKVPKIRRELFALRQDCHWCGVPLSMSVPPDAWNYPTVDHLQPRATGGVTSMENSVLACARCNSSRAGRGWGSTAPIQRNW